MIYQGRVLGMLAAMLAALAVCAPGAALAQTADKTVQKLNAARRTYESDVDIVRSHIERALNTKKAAASKAKDSVAAVAKVNEEEAAFQADGAMPEVEQAAKLQGQYKKARSAMSKAYTEVMRSLDPTKDADVLRAVTAEAKQFENQNDIVPWRTNLVAGKTDAERTLASDGKLAVDPALDGEYRLEIKAKRSGDAGSLSIELPLVGGTRMTVLAVAGDKGEIRVLLTVREGLVRADLGVVRPLGPASAIAGNKGIILHAEGGAIIFEQARVKPVIDGQPPEIPDAPAKKPAGVAPNKADLPAVGTRWKGGFTDRTKKYAATEAVTSESSGNTLAIKIKTIAGSYEWRFTINGGAASLDNVLPLPGSGGAQFTDIHVSGTLKDGELSVSGRWRWQGAKGGGGGTAMTLDLTRD